LTPFLTNGGAEMEKPGEEWLGVVVAGGGACPNRLGRCPDEDDCVGGKLKKKGAGHGVGFRRREVPRRLDEPPAWS
jgi:hypothetical protein